MSKPRVEDEEGEQEKVTAKKRWRRRRPVLGCAEHSPESLSPVNSGGGGVEAKMVARTSVWCIRGAYNGLLGGRPSKFVVIGL